MKTIKQDLLEVIKKVKNKRKDRLFIIDLETADVYSTSRLENVQLKELQKPLAAEINTSEDIDILNKLISSISVSEKYRIECDGMFTKIEIGRTFIIDSLSMEISAFPRNEIDFTEVDLVNTEYLKQIFLDNYILDMSKTNRETVDWFLGFMASNNGYTISKSDGQYGSQLIIDKTNKTIRPVNNNLTDRDKFLLEIKDFKSLFDGIIA